MPASGGLMVYWDDVVSAREIWDEEQPAGSQNDT